jgi:xanthine dehydrogenase accessory factor
VQLRFHEKILEWSRAGKGVAVATIVETVGSTPRKTGARMLVSSDLDLYGTIGGGCVEADVIFAARDVLRTLKPRLLRVDIKAKSAEELDMLCGGEITFFVEPVMPDKRLLICGGGHISRALAHIVQGMDFRVTVIDDRPQFSNEGRFPQVDQCIAAPYEELAARVEFTRHTFVVIVTRGHTGDEACLRQALRSPACFIAMIGSRAKWANIRARLREEGFTEEQLARVHSPAGIDIGSITPEEIALSVAAQLVQERARFFREGFPEAAAPAATPARKAGKKAAKKARA